MEIQLEFNSSWPNSSYSANADAQANEGKEIPPEELLRDGYCDLDDEDQAALFQVRLIFHRLEPTFRFMVI